MCIFPEYENTMVRVIQEIPFSSSFSTSNSPLMISVSQWLEKEKLSSVLGSYKFGSQENEKLFPLFKEWSTSMSLVYKFNLFSFATTTTTTFCHISNIFPSLAEGFWFCIYFSLFLESFVIYTLVKIYCEVFGCIWDLVLLL